MSSDPFDELKQREEQKRDAAWDPRQRWRAFQETIDWLDAQAPVSRNSPQRCLELQRQKLRGE